MSMQFGNLCIFIVLMKDEFFKLFMAEK